MSSIIKKGPEQAILSAMESGEVKLSKKGTSIQARLCDGRRSEEVPLTTVFFYIFGGVQIRVSHKLFLT